MERGNELHLQFGAVLSFFVSVYATFFAIGKMYIFQKSYSTAAYIEVITFIK